MSIVATTTFSVTDRAAVSTSVTDLLLPPVGLGTGGNGRLTHPTLASGSPQIYDYASRPSETVNVEVVGLTPPVWLHSPTISGAVNTRWLGVLAGTLIVERWTNGDTGGLLTQLNALWTIYSNQDSLDPDAGEYLTLAPNYGSVLELQVVMTALRSGGVDYTIVRRLAQASTPLAPAPVEAEYRVVSIVGG